MLDQALFEECVEWIATQLEEENIFLDGGLIALILETEQRAGAESAASMEIATRIEELLVEQGVRGAPDAVNARLILAVLQWEDEFLALAGQPRPV